MVNFTGSVYEMMKVETGTMSGFSFIVNIFGVHRSSYLALWVLDVRRRRIACKCSLRLMFH